MNWRRGITRLYIAFIILWVGGFAAVAIFSGSSVAYSWVNEDLAPVRKEVMKTCGDIRADLFMDREERAELRTRWRELEDELLELTLEPGGRLDDLLAKALGVGGMVDELETQVPGLQVAIRAQ